MSADPGTAVRARAAQALAAVLDGATLEAALAAHLEGIAQRDRALARELCAGSLRFFPRLDALVGAMLERPLRRKDRVVHMLMVIGIYQLAELRIPAHAAVSATVGAVAVLDRRHARGLVNAVLRRYQRDDATLEATLTEAARCSHPPWLWRLLGEQWAEQREGIAEAANARPPMDLRVNRLRQSRDDYLRELESAGIEARAIHGDAALRLAAPLDVDDLPGFRDGLCSVQDETAQRAAGCIDVVPGLRVLDACAAPGGKACHLLERCPDLDLTAMDVSAERLRRVEENLQRLKLRATLREGDARETPPEDEALFDVVIVDAPCSATGVIRRHPDIKVLRRREDIAGFADQQLAILRGLWPRLRAGGELLYITCSVLREENSDVVATFLHGQRDSREVPLELPDAIPCDHGQQILPSVAGGDGLYFAKLAKAP